LGQWEWLQVRNANKSARECRSLALFIGIDWALRIAVDFFYYDHKD